MATAVCAHAQAEPVILSTGEQVACVCISCYYPLPRNWIQGQVDRANREAYCQHTNWLEMPCFGVITVDATCIECGTWRDA